MSRAEVLGFYYSSFHLLEETNMVSANMAAGQYASISAASWEIRTNKGLKGISEAPHWVNISITNEHSTVLDHFRQETRSEKIFLRLRGQGHRTVGSPWFRGWGRWGCVWGVSSLLWFSHVTFHCWLCTLWGVKDPLWDLIKVMDPLPRKTNSHKFADKFKGFVDPLQLYCSPQIISPCLMWISYSTFTSSKEMKYLVSWFWRSDSRVWGITTSGKRKASQLSFLTLLSLKAWWSLKTACSPQMKYHALCMIF